MWDWRILVPLSIFILGQIITGLIFGTRIGVKVDTILERFTLLEAKVDKKLEDMWQNMGRIDRTVSNIEGRLAGTRRERP